VTGAPRAVLTLAVFAGMLALVVARPRRWNEAWWTVLGAAAMLVLGLVSPPLPCPVEACPLADWLPAANTPEVELPHAPAIEKRPSKAKSVQSTSLHDRPVEKQSLRGGWGLPAASGTMPG
jgi:hypothetical protein